MPESAFCEVCGKLVVPIARGKREKLNVKGQPIMIDSTVGHCPECNNEVFDEALENSNLRKAYAVFAKKNGLVTPQEIRAIRKKYGLSQSLFARGLGIGAATIQRYEEGSIPAKSNSDLIRSVSDPTEFKRVVEMNSQLLSQKDLESISEAIESVIDNDRDRIQLAALEKTLTLSYRGNTPCPLNGFRKFDPEKLLGIVATIFQTMRDMKEEAKLYATQLLKMLWLIETAHFKRKTVSISGIVFAHLPHGPVPEKWGTLLDYLKARETVNCDIDDLGQIFTPNDLTASVYLNDEEKQLVSQTVRKYCRKSCRELSKITHFDQRYRKTIDGQLISYA